MELCLNWNLEISPDPFSLLIKTSKPTHLTPTIRCHLNTSRRTPRPQPPLDGQRKFFNRKKIVAGDIKFHEHFLCFLFWNINTVNLQEEFNEFIYVQLAIAVPVHDVQPMKSDFLNFLYRDFLLAALQFRKIDIV